MLRRAIVALCLICGVAGAQPAPRGRNLPLHYMTTIAPPSQQYPMVVLVTMGIGSLIWERHGHIALCVLEQDVANDACYNYGVGDFHDPAAMAWGFFRGTHSFWVEKMEPEHMLQVYRYFDRTVWAQIIPLTPDQVQQVIKKLEIDILEMNKYYAYDHFDDNCTTRVRDILDNATGGSLHKLTGDEDGKTFRDLARDGFYGMKLPLIITDIAMGRSTDRVPDYWERMFLPQYLREAIAKLYNVAPTILYERKECRTATEQAAVADCTARGIPPASSDDSGRVIFALILIALTSPAWISRLVNRFQRTGLAIALIPPALFGLIFWFLAIISPLPYVRWNESCLILMPFDFALFFLRPEFKEKYAKARVVEIGLVFALHLVGIIKAPLIALMLWPAIPLATVAFWPKRVPPSSK